MNRHFARATALAAACALVTGCFSVQARQRPDTGGAPETGGVALRVYADDEARKAGQPGPRGLFVELLKTPETRARIAHMLETGKPLRN